MGCTGLLPCDWAGPPRKKHPHPWPTFFKLTGMMNSDAPMLTRGDPKTDRQTAVQQHWSGDMNLRPNSTGEIYFTPASCKLPVRSYNYTDSTLVVLFGSLFVFVPHCPFFKMDRAGHVFL